MAVILIIAARPLADLVYLSGQYSAATTDGLRSLYAAAGEALLARFNGTAWMVFTVFLALSGLISSLLMLMSHFFQKFTAITGMIAKCTRIVFLYPSGWYVFAIRRDDWGRGVVSPRCPGFLPAQPGDEIQAD